MNRNNLFRQYFNFSKNEFRGIVVILLLILVLYIAPNLYHSKDVVIKRDPVIEQQIAALFDKEDYNKDKLEEIISPDSLKMFVFDPNKIDSVGWKKLGLSSKTTHTILNYRNKGGWFKDTGDIRKMWSLKKVDADRIIPYISIEEREHQKYPKPEWLKKKEEIPALASIDINKAEAEDMRNVPGLEYPLPYKIVYYREKLGGFLQIEQVKETAGMNDTVYQAIRKYLKIVPVLVKKININTATDDDLSQHPYIVRNIAKAIFIYRQQHGNYKHVEDIKKIVFLKEEVYKKIAPYLSITD